MLTKTLTGLAIALALFAFTLPATAQQAQQPDKYLLLATNRTGTMEDELNEAGARGYHFAGTQGGETAFGGNEVVIIMRLDPEGRRFRYIFVGMTVFSSTFGGNEAAVILEGEIGGAPPR